jgi:hypothetical protein
MATYSEHPAGTEAGTEAVSESGSVTPAVLLRCPVQSYAWGRRGISSEVARLKRYDYIKTGSVGYLLNMYIPHNVL